MGMQQQIQFENHVGEILAGTLHQPDHSSVGAVVAGHCFTCSRHTGIIRRVCDALSQRGFVVLRFDFSGNGQSQGRFEHSTWSKQVLEMNAAVNLMKDQGAGWIGLAGHSLGAAIALLTARQNDSIAAVCRLAGRTSPSRPVYFLTSTQREILAADGQVEFTSRGRKLNIKQAFFDDAETHDLTAATRSLAIPMLVVHGDQDEVIPVAEAYLARDANPQHVAVSIIEGGDHMFSRTEHQEQIGRLVADWFRRLVD
jgi:uncharacterized protein